MGWDRKKPWENKYRHAYRPQASFKPKIKPSTNSVKMPRIGIPNILNKTCLLLIAFCVVLFVLLYLNVSTGSYISILEGNKTSLQNKIKACDDEKSTLNSDLGICNENLAGKTSALTICENEKNSFSSSASSCNNKLNTCEKDRTNYKSDYTVCKNDIRDFEDFLDDEDLDNLRDLEDYIDDLKNDEDGCQDDLDDCQDDKDNLQNNYDSMKTNYAKDYCCLLNKTHYTISSNKITCGTSGTAITC